MKTAFTRLAPGVVALLLVLSAGCAPQTAATQAPAPSIPASYYDCIEVVPTMLEAGYFSNYANLAESHALYDNKVYVFKDMTVDTWLIREAAQGILWADMIECPVVNVEAAQKLKIGDHLDLVGICLGPKELTDNQLLFKDCYVLPAGVLQLPAAGGSTFTLYY